MTRGLLVMVWMTASLIPGTTRAEPHFSGRTGLRCSRCHTSPTGGGKRSPYGALYAHTSLTMQGANPARRLPMAKTSEGGWAVTSVATGEVTPWLGIGADLRVQNTTTLSDEKENTFDTSQGTLYLEIRPVPGRLTLYLDEEVASGGARSREAWALLRGPWSTYLKGGWLLPPFGLRLLDDDAYTRRATGATFANPDMGLEVGGELGPLFAALSVTNGNLSAVDSDRLKAFHGLVELNLPVARFGLSGAYNPSEEGCRAMTGGFATMRLGRLTLMAEADWIMERPADHARWAHQLAAMSQLDLLVTKGMSLNAGYDYHDADLELSQDRRQRFLLGVSLFPFRMLETRLSYVIKQSETALPQDRADRLEVTLHVFM